MAEFEPILPQESELTALELGRAMLADTIERGREAEGLEDVEFQELILGSISEEQSSAFAILQEAGSAVNWDGLSEAEKHLRDEDDALKAAAASAEAAMQAELSGLDSMLERSVRLAPSAREQAEKLANTRRQDIQARFEASTEAVRRQQAEKMTAFYKVYESAGQAWPIPNLLDMAEVVLPQVTVDVEEGVVAEAMLAGVDIANEDDEEPTIIDDAVTLMTTVYEGGKSVDMLAISDAVLPPGETAELDAEDKVRRVMSIFRGEDGQAVTAALAELGLTAIHGWRIIRSQDGAIARKRVVKVVETDAINNLTYTTALVVYAEEGSTVHDVWLDDVEDDEMPEIVLATAAPDTELAPSDAGRETKKPNWRTEFKAALGMAIQALENHDLLTEEPIVGSKLRHRAYNMSGTLGTTTNIQRAFENKLLPQAAADDHLAYGFSAPEILCLYMFNSHRDTLHGNTARGKEALKIIDEALQGYFERKRQAEDDRR